MSQVSSYIVRDEIRTHAPVGRVLFTGPDDARDYRTKVLDPTYVGRAASSPEATGDLQYLYKAPRSCPPPLPKCARVGEIGWGVSTQPDFSGPQTGHQIQLKTFRQANEDRYTHRYQTPYYPAPTNEQQMAATNALLQRLGSTTSSNITNEDMGKQ